MAIKKSELYSSLWASCDELRGGMDASQYKDYVLVMLFVKYVSDKYYGVPFAPIIIPKGASFKDMVALKGKPDIGDQINKKIIGPLRDANKLSAMPDFNSAEKLGSGKELVDRLTNLIGIFENPALNFGKNRAEGDDILGDAYEYLMRHFATESGKSKGQFYTPAEVSRVIAQIIGIHDAPTSSQTTVYDPTCGSGSLLLKVGDEAGTRVALYGQEKDAATAGLARMNMILHDNPTAEIVQGNTLANPLYKTEKGELKTFDFVVANPPFSDKRWSTGLHPHEGGIASAHGEGQGAKDYGRFAHFGIPPAKQGDYAYLLHIVHSLKTRGKGACILPHGVLFRGNAEADIRRNLLLKGYIKGIIGLPANLFYGTGIPACIIVIDKENAQARRGIFMIDASKGFIKDGNKNRLREQDIHRIVDTFNRLDDSDPRYARMVPLEEIASERNGFNLNLPRYIDSSDPEDIQDIDGHLRGGIPDADIDGPESQLAPYWQILPALREALLESAGRPGYNRLRLPIAEVRAAILEHPEFATFKTRVTAIFDGWRAANRPHLEAFDRDGRPKALITTLSEALLAAFRQAPLLDPYAIYQHLMSYWAETMQDDAYLIGADGWKAETYRVMEEVKAGKKKGEMKDRGWACDLIPKPYIVARYFAAEQTRLDVLQGELDGVTAEIEALEEEHAGEEGALADLERINKAEVGRRVKEITGDPEYADELKVLKQWQKLEQRQADLKARIKDSDARLDRFAYEKYPQLSLAEIKTLVIDDKWLTRLESDMHGELERVSQTLTGRIRQLAERYAEPLPELVDEVAALSAKVDGHLKRMGAVWN